MAVALSLSPAWAQERTVNFYNWSNYMAPGVLEDFTKETGIKVVYDTFDANETLETRLLAGKSGYDVVVPTGYFLQRQITAKVFLKLDKSKLPNLANAWPVVTSQLATYDPDNNYAANYMWGTTGIGYNVKTAARILGPDAKIDSWDIVFKPENLAKFKDCGIHMLDSADDILPAALSYLGIDPNSTKQADLEKAADLVSKIRPNVRKFHSSEYLGALASGGDLLRGGLVGRHHAGAQPRGGSKKRRRDRLHHPERGCADVLRQSRDSRGCEERRGSLRADQLSLPPRGRGEEFRFPVLRQRQSREPEADRSEDFERPQHLSGRSDAEKAVRHQGARSRDATRDQPAVDTGEDGEMMGRGADVAAPVIASEAKQSIAPQAQRWIASSLRFSQ
ncbi:hypothetical protein V1292_005890 [Bradyrhizobium sp. AZCC 1719]